MKKKLLCVLLLFICLVSSRSFGDGMDYVVVLDMPSEQENKNLDYFDLVLKPGQIINLSFNIKNLSNIDKDFEIIPTRATTDDEGVIEYTNTSKEYDDSLLHPFDKLTGKKEKISIGGNSNKTVNYTVRMPKKNLDGVILGGYYIREIPNESKEGGNTFSYVVGVKLSTGKNIKKAKFNLNKITPVIKNDLPTIKANIQNTESVITRNLTFESKVKNLKGRELMSFREENIQMAPNSNFNYGLLIEEKVKSGEYILEIKITDQDKNSWFLSKNFSITKTEEGELNLADRLDYFKVSFLIGVILLLTVILLIMVIYIKKENNE